MVPLLVPANHVSRCSERSDVTRRLRQWDRALFFDRPAASGACRLTWRGYRESRCNHGDGFSKTLRASRSYSYVVNPQANCVNGWE